MSLEAVWLRHGIPFSYYVDSHSIFRFVERRDSVWKKQYLKTDDADPQWKRIMNECRVKVTYALSPQAKGKIERPYRWLQDRIVRTCAREGIRTIDGARDALRSEVHRYNEHQVHSTTGEIPIVRFEEPSKKRSISFVRSRCRTRSNRQRISSASRKRGQRTPTGGFPSTVSS